MGNGFMFCLPNRSFVYLKLKTMGLYCDLKSGLIDRIGEFFEVFARLNWKDIS